MSVVVEKYRINTPTLALVLRDGRHVAHILEKGSTVIVERAEIGRLIEVLWNDVKALMLAQELAAHADKIPG